MWRPAVWCGNLLDFASFVVAFDQLLHVDAFLGLGAFEFPELNQVGYAVIPSAGNTELEQRELLDRGLVRVVVDLGLFRTPLTPTRTGVQLPFDHTLRRRAEQEGIFTCV